MAGPAPMGPGWTQPEEAMWVFLPIGSIPVGGAQAVRKLRELGGGQILGPFPFHSWLLNLALQMWNVMSKEPEVVCEVLTRLVGLT